MNDFPRSESDRLRAAVRGIHTPPRREPVVTLTEFLLARIAEDEAVLREPQYADVVEPIDLRQLLADYEAKRRIVENCAGWEAEYSESFVAESHWANWVARQLAAVYADHPDYRDEWRP